MKRLAKVLENGKTQSKNAFEVAEEVVKEGRLIADEDVGRNKEMAREGAEWLVKEVGGADGIKLNVLTVCNTGSLATSGEWPSLIATHRTLNDLTLSGYGTALGLITHLFETSHLKTAYYTQSAPYHQVSWL